MKLRGLVAVLLVLTVATGAMAAPFTAKVSQVIGVARLERPKVTTLLRDGVVLQAGDRIRVEKGSVMLSWPDGTQGKLVAGTRITLEAAKGSDAVTRTRLENGQYWLNVVKYARRPSRFDVDTGRTMGAVEGTEVRFTYDDSTEVSSIQVWEGTVQCLVHTGTMEKLCRKVRSSWVPTHDQKGHEVLDHGLMDPMKPGSWEGPQSHRDPRCDPDMNPWPSSR